LTIALLLVGGIIGWNLYAEYKMTDGQERGLLVAQAMVMDKNLEHQLTATNHAIDSIRHDLPALMAKNDGMASVKHRLEVMRGAMPTKEEIIGRPVFEIYHPDCSEKSKRDLPVIR
jgi:hypothetical protein